MIRLRNMIIRIEIIQPKITLEIKIEKIDIIRTIVIIGTVEIKKVMDKEESMATKEIDPNIN